MRDRVLSRVERDVSPDDGIFMLKVREEQMERSTTAVDSQETLRGRYAYDDIETSSTTVVSAKMLGPGRSHIIKEEGSHVAVWHSIIQNLTRFGTKSLP